MTDSYGTEAVFEQAIRDNPADADTILIFADWLEEQGDDRARFLRGNRFCADCIPILGLWRSATIWHNGDWTCPRKTPVRLEYDVQRTYEFAGGVSGPAVWTLYLALGETDLDSPFNDNVRLRATFRRSGPRFDLQALPLPIVHRDLNFTSNDLQWLRNQHPVPIQRDDLIEDDQPNFNALQGIMARYMTGIERQIMLPQGMDVQPLQLQWNQYPRGTEVYGPANELRAEDGLPIQIGSILLDDRGERVGVAMQAGPDEQGRLHVRLF